jgi:mono/diheme cytochrome c family protein
VVKQNNGGLQAFLRRAGMRRKTFRNNVVLAIAGLAVLGCGLAIAADSATSPATQTTVANTAPGGLTGWVIPDPASPPADPTQAALIARGKYLTVAGDCLPCHSVQGRPAFSGGLAVASPVGAVYSPNITPSKQYGIGNYTDQQFWNALHNGIAPGSSLLVFPKYLYPSMPYDAYSKLSYQDVMAIKAYLMSLPAVDTPDKPTQIPFPLNIRAALLGWRMLFFSPQPMQYDASWSPQVKNGAFLVQALGHCSDCHTPRNLLFASENSKFLGGGHILSQSWYAPNISSDQTNGIGAWQPAELLNYLHNGGTLGIGAPFGPMQEVVHDSLSRLPESDVQDIAAYLQTGTAPQTTPAPPRPPLTNAAYGAQVYADNCARCHGADGGGVENNFPNLSANQAIASGPPNNVIAMVLGGFGPWHNDQSAMPGFRNTLSDAQIAAVTNFLRTSWGNTGAADATPDLVARLRGQTDTQISLDAGTMQASLQSGAETRVFDDINGAFTRTGDTLNCQLNANLMTDNPADTMHIAGICGQGGTVVEAVVTQNGQTAPLLLTLHATGPGLDLTGKMPDGSSRFFAHIHLVTSND